MGIEEIENMANVVNMLNPCAAVNQYIIKENQDEFTEMGLEYLIHQGLKRGRSIHQAERHE